MRPAVVIGVGAVTSRSQQEVGDLFGLGAASSRGWHRGVSVVNDGIPTQALLRRRAARRSPRTASAIIDGALRIQSTRFARFSGYVAARERGAAGEVGEVRAVARPCDESSSVMAVRAAELRGDQPLRLTRGTSLPSGPSAYSGFTGLAAAPTATPRSPPASCAMTRNRMLACERPQYSAHWPRNVPGLSASIVSLFVVARHDVPLAGELGHPEGVDHVAPTVCDLARLQLDVHLAAGGDVQLVGGDDLGRCPGYSNCHHHCLPTTVTSSASGRASRRGRRSCATVGTAITARISAGTIVQPISSARVAVDLLRVVVLARRGGGTQIATKIVAAEDDDPDDDRDPRRSG